MRRPRARWRINSGGPFDALQSVSAGSGTGTGAFARAPGARRSAAGGPSSTISPSSKKTIRSATARAKPISWVTHEHRHARLGQLAHDVEHLVDHLRVEGRRRLVEEHDLGLHGQRPGDRHALLLAARELGRVLARLLRDAHPRRGAASPPRRPRSRVQLAHPHRRQGDVLEHGQVREQVERLEDHPDLAADGGDVADVVGQLDAVDDDLAALVLLEPVDGADERRLARSRRRRR